MTIWIPRNLRLAGMVVAWLFVVGVGASAERAFVFGETPGALPKTVVPHHYRVWLKPDPEALTTKGTVEIEVDVRENVETIQLNAENLKVSAATLDGGELKVQVDDPILILESPEPIAVGKHTLKMKFEGVINSRPSGLYHVDYLVEGKTARMLVTQMEPADARSVLPCWDEPAFRATFALTVEIPDSLEAFSNMPVAAEIAGESGLKLVQFEPTPVMSTYLLALAVGNFEVLRDEADGIALGIVTPVGMGGQGRYAMEVTKKLIPYYREYFGVRYPLPKLDQIAVPNKAGAMENWGLITYGENSLLFEEGRSSQSTRERIFGIVAHEIAHQWFGNLVTMAWWDNLWLNEGFASWMGTKATDHFNPEWQIWLRSNGGKNWAMARDSLESTHPIQQPVVTVGEALDMFDAISYQKGQAIIRMLESYVGPEAFRDGLRAYMEAHAYSNTTSEDLWKALESKSGKQIRALASEWTGQAGFPVVGVAWDDAGKVVLTQERFEIGPWKAAGATWPIPLTFRSVNDPAKRATLLFAEPSQDTGLEGAWKGNASGAGFYRVDYSKELAEEIAAHLDGFSPEDRLNLLSDSWAMFTAGRSPLSRVLVLCEQLKGDPTQAIATTIVDILDGIHSRVRDTPLLEPFSAYARALVRPQLDRLGWDAKDGEPPTEVTLRSRVLTALGKWGEPAVVTESKDRFQRFLDDPTSLPPNLCWPVLVTVGRYADAETYARLRALALSAENTEERRVFFSALAAAEDPMLAERTLDLSLDERVPPDIATRLVSGVSWDGHHPALAWEFADFHFDSLNARLSSLRSNEYFPALARELFDRDAARALKDFQKRHLTTAHDLAVERALLDIEIEKDVRSRVRKQVADILRNAQSLTQ